MTKSTELPTRLPAWQALEAHYLKVRELHLRNLFADDPQRAERMTVEAVGIYFDYSKHRITDETRMGRDPGEIYRDLMSEFGEPAYNRVEAPATPEQKKLLAKLSPRQIKFTELASEKIQTVLTRAPGNAAPIGGVKVVAENGWFAACPSGTEDIDKIYAESFRGEDPLRRVLADAQTIVNDALAAVKTTRKETRGRLC